MKNLKLRPGLLAAFLSIMTIFFIAPAVVNAACVAGETCGGGGTPAVNAPTSTPTSTSTSSGSTDCTSTAQSCLKSNPIVKDLNDVVDFLSAGVGIVVIGMLITGGIQYSMAGGSPDAVGKAKTRITNALVALALYLLIFGFLQWIVPGGLFNS